MSDMDLLPRGPIYRDESASAIADRPDSYAQAMAKWREAAREEAFQTAELNEERNQVPKYINYISGNHWNARRARYKSRASINKVGKARFDILSSLTNSRPAIELSGSREDLDEQSNIVRQVIEHEWVQENMDLSLITAADIALAAGTAFWKIGASSPGIMKIIPCGPDNVMPIQPGFSIQESTAVMYRTWKSILEVKRKFPFVSAHLDREAAVVSNQSNFGYARPPQYDLMTWNRLAPQMKRLLGRRVPQEETGRDFFKAIEWQEFYVEDGTTNDSSRPVIMKDQYLATNQHNWWYWVKPGERLYPRKRLIIFAGKRLIYDGPSSFWHGLYPFASLSLNPVFWSFWGLSPYRDLIPMNMMINTIVAGVEDMIKRALNPTIISKQGAVPNAMWNQFFADMPGGKIFMNPGANPSQDFKYSDAPEIPPYVLDVLVKYLGPEFDKMSGLLDVTSMGQKKQIPGGDTIEQMRDTMQTALQLYGRFIEKFLTDAGIQAVSNVFQFYTVQRRMRMFGKDGISFSDFPFDPAALVPKEENKFDHWKQFSFRVTAGSVHSGKKDRDKQMAIGLFGAGALSIQALHRILEIPDSEQILQEMADQAAMGMAAEGGAPRLTRGQRNGSPV